MDRTRPHDLIETIPAATALATCTARILLGRACAASSGPDEALAWAAAGLCSAWILAEALRAVHAPAHRGRPAALASRRGDYAICSIGLVGTLAGAQQASSGAGSGVSWTSVALLAAVVLGALALWAARHGTSTGRRQ